MGLETAFPVLYTQLVRPGVLPLDTLSLIHILSRDLDREQAAAAFFLGSDMAQGDQSGDTYTYSSKLGACLLYTSRCV